MTKRILTAAVCLCLCLALSACGAPGDNGPAADTAKKSLKEKAQAAVEDIADLTQMPFEDLQDMTGIEETMAAECLYLQGDPLSGREIVAVRAVAAKAAEQVQGLLGDYLEARRRESRNYSPDAYRLQEAASVERRGTAVVLCVGQNARAETAALLDGE